MKKFLLSIGLCISSIGIFAQTIATNFSVNDCNNNNVNLFNVLDGGKVVVIAWPMPCGSCITPILTAYTEVQNALVSNPGKIEFFMADDYANTSCVSLISWSNTNGMPNCTFFSNSAINMNHYGGAAMPKIVIIAGSNHQVYDNQDNVLNTSQFTSALNQALTAAAAVGIDELKAEFINNLISPNPVNGSFLNFPEDISGNADIHVMDVLGNKVQTIRLSSTSRKIQLSEQLNNGVYFINIKDSKGTRISKFILNR